MGYLFLTGATGLLGTYLLRDLSRAGTKLAVLVRPTRFASTRHRIETLLARWERQAGYALPRPVVLEGDLSRPDLGLGTSGLQWVSRHCDAVMHNAASLTFHAESDDAEAEPWRSNIGGTTHVLEFCRSAGIRQFHHVSTAYVCGQRTDHVLESELDVGQTHGNDYESSKCQAEKLVRAADFLDDPTFYRPGIIVGDFQNGFTTTYHGFYVPMKLVATTLSQAAGVATSREELAAAVKYGGERLRSALNLTEKDGKYFVPVDWVSAAMTGVFTNPRLHGQTYHLTPRKPVSILMVQKTIQQIMFENTELSTAEAHAQFDWDQFENYFVEGMEVYRSYWRNDPTFDTTNIQRALPDLLCPELNEAFVRRLCQFAIDSNFGWPKSPPVIPNRDVHEHLRSLIETTGQTNHTGQTGDSDDGMAFVGLRVTGPGGGEWELSLRNGRVTSAQPGIGSRCTATCHLNSTTFDGLATRDLTAEQEIDSGRVLIEGNGVSLNDLTRALESVALQNREQRH